MKRKTQFFFITICSMEELLTVTELQKVSKTSTRNHKHFFKNPSIDLGYQLYNLHNDKISCKRSRPHSLNINEKTINQ